MPRFNPGLEEGLALSTLSLLDAAFDIRAVDESRLTELSKTFLYGLRTLRSSGMTREDILKELGPFSAGADAEHERRLQEFIGALGLAEVRVFCVTTERESADMWRDYAANGSGIVLELVHIPEDSTALLAARQVDYSAEPPVIGSGEDFFLYGENDRLTKAALQAIVSSKRIEWSHQNEWRVVWWLREPDGSLYTDYTFLPGELASLRFGPAASIEFRDEIVSLVRERYPHCRIEN